MPGNIDQPRAIGDRADVVGEGRRLDVDAGPIVAGGGQRAHQPFAEMAGASRYQDFHPMVAPGPLTLEV